MPPSEWTQAWQAFLRLPPLKGAFYATSGALAVGCVLLAGTEMLAPGADQFARSREAAARIPRLERAQRASDESAARRRADLAAMIAETKTRTTAEKLTAATDALYSFHTGRPPRDDGS